MKFCFALVWKLNFFLHKLLYFKEFLKKKKKKMNSFVQKYILYRGAKNAKRI